MVLVGRYVTYILGTLIFSRYPGCLFEFFLIIFSFFLISQLPPAMSPKRNRVLSREELEIQQVLSPGSRSTVSAGLPLPRLLVLPLLPLLFLKIA